MTGTGGGPSVWFAIWAVTTQCVNLALYLAVTRSAHGRWARLGAYLVGCLAPMTACLLWVDPQLHGGAQGAAGSLAIGFAAFFAVWGGVSLLMSRGPTGLRMFMVLVCGVHQVGAFSFSLILMRRVTPEPVGALLGCVVMAATGAFLALKALPSVMKLADNRSWRNLNLTAVLIFALLYMTGIWPTYVPAGAWEDIVRFLVAHAVAIASFPVALAFAERQRTAFALALVERSVKLMTGEVAACRSAIDDARRQRHDRRHHRIVLAEHLLRGQTDRALAYLERLDDEADRSAVSRFVWCENDTINAILSGYARKADAKGIRLEVTIHVGRKVSLPDIDVVAFVANLLENAINAAGRGDVVTVALRQRERTVGMTVTNPVPEGFRLSEQGLPCDEPGFGIASVRHVVRRHNGELEYALNDGVLTCQAVLRLETGGEHDDCAL